MSRAIADPAAARTTCAERWVVLGGFAAAWLCTIPVFLYDGGLEAIAALWLAATVWAMLSSLALALRQGLSNRDWSAFGRYELTDSTELIDWSTKTGEYAWMLVAEEHERLMRGD